MSQNIDYKEDVIPSTNEIIELYRNAGLNRPIDDFERITQMYMNSNLIISAWDKNELIGISRALTDFCYCCYVSDLAVRHEYQKLGVGSMLMKLTKNRIGDQCMLLLLSAPTAIGYYHKLGMDKVENGFIIKRKL